MSELKTFRQVYEYLESLPLGFTYLDLVQIYKHSENRFDVNGKPFHHLGNAAQEICLRYTDIQA